MIPVPYAAFCKVALYTGARRGELLVARWDQVDIKRGLLTLPTSRSGKPRFIDRLVLAGVDLVTIRELGGWSEKGGLGLLQRYAHVGEGHKRQAIGALARGERLVRTDTRTDTKTEGATQAPVAAAG